MVIGFLIAYVGFICIKEQSIGLYIGGINVVLIQRYPKFAKNASLGVCFRLLLQFGSNKNAKFFFNLSLHQQYALFQPILDIHASVNLLQTLCNRQNGRY